MDEKICGTPITGEYIAKRMKKALGPHAILRSVDAEEIAVGQGYLSNILRIKLTWEENQENNLPETVIVKVPTVESLHKLMDTQLSGVEESEKIKALIGQAVTTAHNAECDLYQLFGKSPPVAMPRYFVALPVAEEAPGMIILEDLSKRAAIPQSWVRGMTYPQVLAAVTEVARLHAWSLTTKVDWRNRVRKFEDREQSMRSFLGPLPAGYKLAKETYPNEFGSLDIEKLSALTTHDSFAAIMIEHREFVDDVLTHGDFHLDNILYEKNADDTVSDRLVALIDFQTVVQGSPAYDVARLLSLGVSHKIRRDHNKKILRRYYDEVKSIAGDKFTATVDQMRRLLDRQFALSAILAIASIPTMNHVMVKSEGEQKAKDEEEILERLKANYDDASRIFGL